MGGFTFVLRLGGAGVEGWVDLVADVFSRTDERLVCSSRDGWLHEKDIDLFAKYLTAERPVSESSCSDMELGLCFQFVHTALQAPPDSFRLKVEVNKRFVDSIWVNIEGWVEASQLDVFAAQLRSIAAEIRGASLPAPQALPMPVLEPQLAAPRDGRLMGQALLEGEMSDLMFSFYELGSAVELEIELRFGRVLPRFTVVQLTREELEELAEFISPARFRVTAPVIDAFWLLYEKRSCELCGGRLKIELEQPDEAYWAEVGGPDELGIILDLYAPLRGGDSESLLGSGFEVKEARYGPLRACLADVLRQLG